ncbi:tripartite tricarboxylate transporter permease [Nocardioides carbamazepini]|uniref:tripartite tricarboxylate transporter permease n=1 Tax=Nocardioides carbamazepini TaxID=2854259 RepID=UPI00214A6495|nr:tripartite tricarboxylate transporter permease [Nocardioides carbamazepini]MCR1786164.1 tripartite tricarboxylate transporter permease [Nocardioides carbamazepini]
MSAELLDGITAALLAGLAGAVIFSLLGLVSGTDETATLAPLTLAVVLLGVPPAGVLTFFIAGAAAKHMTHAVPTTLLGIPGDTMAIALMEEANSLRRLGVPHIALRKMVSAAVLSALIAIPVSVLAASALATIADDIKQVIPYLFPVIAIAIAYLSKGRWASVIALVPLTAMITGLNTFVAAETGKTLAISFFVGLAVGPMIVDLVGLASPLTRASLLRDRRPTFWLAPEDGADGSAAAAPRNPLRVLSRSEATTTAAAAGVTSLTFVVSPLAMAILVGDIVGARVKHAYQRLTRVISVRNGVTDSTYLAETLIPLVAVGLPLSPIAAGAAAPLFNAPPVFTVGGDGVELHNLHTLLSPTQFLVYGLIGVLAAALIAYPLTVTYARRAALFVARNLSHEAVVGAFAGLVLVVAMYEGGVWGVVVMLTVGLVGGVLNKVIGMHVGVQCMAYYVSVLTVPVLL